MWRWLDRAIRVGPFVFAVAFLGCSSSTSPVPASISLTFNGDTSLAMIVGDRVPLTVTVTNDDGRVVQDLGPRVFVSRDPSIVSIDSTGVASANHVGATLVVVTETSGGMTLSDSVEVRVAMVVGGAPGHS